PAVRGHVPELDCEGRQIEPAQIVDDRQLPGVEREGCELRIPVGGMPFAEFPAGGEVPESHLTWYGTWPIHGRQYLAVDRKSHYPDLFRQGETSLGGVRLVVGRRGAERPAADQENCRGDGSQ